ncbi:MAG TPA: beta-galactosidase, partial [Verrucomicrobiales bacterium]|nr:beta-galactosidase [Verrucomicrobiales bacterium]
MNPLCRAALVLALLPLQHASSEVPAPRPWNEYRTVMWVGDSVWKKPGRLPLFIQRLKEMGITTAMVHGDADPKPWVEAGFPYYVENVINKGLCLKWNSPVSDWDAVVTKWAKNGRPAADLVRPYSLDDPEWLQWGTQRMKDFAAKHKGNHPLATDIRDELSTTMSANPFDYDFSDHTLKAFRTWLQARYPSLEALNAGWETKFTSWDEVKPFTTDQIKNRMSSGDALPRGNPDWQALRQLKFPPAAAPAKPTALNFSPWADFRTYMDLSLSRALGAFRDASRSVDSDTPVGIEGTQMPHAFGGYDLWQLSQALDWVEPYDICNSREIFGSFMPGKPIVTTVGEKDARAAQRRLWHLLLLGDRGCIIWWSEDCIDWSRDDCPLT